MFRIRSIHDDLHPANRAVLAGVGKILRSQIPGLTDADIGSIRAQLIDPITKRFRLTLYIAEDGRSTLQGCAVLMHDPDVNFCYLDYIASAQGFTSRGIGGALYQRLREEARALNAHGLFFECLPDDPARISTDDVLGQNQARLRFYEQFGARPIVGTAYETPLKAGELDAPHLVFDDLDRDTPLRRSVARRVVLAILERKYAGLCSPEYVRTVVDSFRADPVAVREPRYVQRRPAASTVKKSALVPLIVNDRHAIHQVRDRGYVEAPVRISAILRDLEPSGYFQSVPAADYADRHMTAVHDRRLVNYLRRACANVTPANSIYPYVFPVRNAAHPPKDLGLQAGYYCIDTFTPLNEQAYLAAREAVDCALTAADRVSAGHSFAYALVRPPGHHAERSVFGGFCYFNNTAIAAERLARRGRIAILDVDFHHGNGQQDIFYARGDVLTVSVHGHPSFAYPYFSGYADETGVDAGEGFNLNVPLPEDCDTAQYRRGLQRALRRISDFKCDFLVVALGLDTARGDPTGSWNLRAPDFHANGRMIAELRLPTLVVQEGGYRTRTLGANVRAFFAGLLGQAS